MDDIIEISSFDLNDNKSSKTMSFGSGGAGGAGGSRSSNFGGGLELLMNDKVKEGSSKSSGDINLEDINNLEDELNQLADETIQIGSSEPMSSGSTYKAKSDLFGSTSTSGGTSEKFSVRFDDSATGSSSSSSSSSSYGQEKETNSTWDGYGKFNNIPMNPDQGGDGAPKQPQMSKEELLREKFKYLKKLEALEKKGVEISKKYTMESPLLEMQGEYETIMEEKNKQNSVKFQGNMMMAIVNGIEFLNGRFDPFDIKLDGWGEQINENITDYDEIFGELYEKYKSKASMAPELKLMFQLGGSAMMVHMTNTMFKSAMPGMDDIMRQNPDLMRQFQSAAVNSMGQSNPGFAGFMSGLMDPGSMNGPPPPMATQGPMGPPPSRDRGGNNSSSFSSVRPNFSNANINMNDGINIRENYSDSAPSFMQSSGAERSSRRPEMKGPSDISDILSGLKTKTINIQEAPQQQNSNSNVGANSNNNSMISLNDLKELQGDGNLPKKSKRRPKSDKNTVSLDI
jgi:hypothetical protein